MSFVVSIYIALNSVILYTQSLIKENITLKSNIIFYLTLLYCNYVYFELALALDSYYGIEVGVEPTLS